MGIIIGNKSNIIFYPVHSFRNSNASIQVWCIGGRTMCPKFLDTISPFEVDDGLKALQICSKLRRSML
jgi:hypothetical protein